MCFVLIFEHFEISPDEPIRFRHSVLPKMASAEKTWKPTLIGCKTVALISRKRMFPDFVKKKKKTLIIVVYNFEIVVQDDGFPCKKSYCEIMSASDTMY